MSDPRLLEARRAFDGAFAAPRAAATVAYEDVLQLGVGGSDLLVSLAGLGGLQALPRLMPVPGRRTGLLGLAGVRGRLVPVFDLATLLGRSGAAPRWLLLGPGADPVGLGVEIVRGQLRVPSDSRRPATAAQQAPGITESVVVGEQVHPLLQVPVLLQTLAGVAGSVA